MSKLEENNEKISEAQEETPLSDQVQLYKHENFTDGHLVYIDVMTPVKFSGTGKVSIDKNQPKKFIGKSQVDFGGNVVPYTFMIEKANNIKDAIDNFDSALDQALERTKERMEEMQKEEQNKLIVPDEENKIIT